MRHTTQAVQQVQYQPGLWLPVVDDQQSTAAFEPTGQGAQAAEVHE
ncbi:hypothetical protein ACWGHM_40210 [Streptomyces sp. NPDC054904]